MRLRFFFKSTNSKFTRNKTKSSNPDHTSLDVCIGARGFCAPPSHPHTTPTVHTHTHTGECRQRSRPRLWRTNSYTPIRAAVLIVLCVRARRVHRQFDPLLSALSLYDRPHERCSNSSSAASVCTSVSTCTCNRHSGALTLTHRNQPSAFRIRITCGLSHASSTSAQLATSLHHCHRVLSSRPAQRSASPFSLSSSGDHRACVVVKTIPQIHTHTHTHPHRTTRIEVYHWPVLGIQPAATPR